MRWMVALIWRLPPRSRRWRLVLPELTGIGATPAARASLASVLKRAAPAISPTSLAAVSGPKPGSVEQVRRDLRDQVGDLGFERLDRLAQFADAAQLVAGDADAHRLLGPREPARDARSPVAVEQRAAGQLQLGPEVVQMPLQRVVERHARPDQPLAVIDEQPQVELGPVEVRRRQRVQALAQRRSGDRKRVDAVGLAAPARFAPRRRHQLAGNPQHPLAPLDQKPLQRARDMPAVLQRPHPFCAQASRPAPATPPSPSRRTGPSARRAARRSSLRPRRSCASACGCPHRARSLTSSTSTRTSGRPADMACLGRCHAPIKSRRTSPTGDERHSKRWSGPHGRQPQRESARRRSGPSPRVGRHRRAAIETASLKAVAVLFARTLLPRHRRGTTRADPARPLAVGRTRREALHVVVTSFTVSMPWTPT